jgi:riboflavin kinase/FMN adenylyltransferase
MTTIFGLENYRTPPRNPVLTIGNFDGVHRGHLALLRKCVDRAAAIDGTSLVLTFEPHPLRVLKPDADLPLICVLDRKLELIEAAGIGVTVVAQFTRNFAAITAVDFVQKILAGKLGIRELVVGHDYTFGRGREGDLALLAQLAPRHGFVVHEVGPVEVEGEVVSSTRIREKIQAGDIPAANRLLGRQYQLRGRVVRGRNRGGRLLGFPTANLRPANELLPPIGVYAVLVELNGEVRQGVTNIGTNPTFGEEALSVETYILDFEGELYDRVIRLKFCRRLRGQIKFDGVDALAAQIAQDVAEARRWLDNDYKSIKQ